MKVPRCRFEQLAEKSLKEIPKRFLDLLVDLEISVRSSPGAEAGRWQGSKTLLGLYRGMSRADMASPYSGSHPPARILLYQTNIESMCNNSQELVRQIRITLRHELGHHFGFSDGDLRKKWPEGA